MPRTQYTTLNRYQENSCPIKEKFFVSYAVQGELLADEPGVRAGLPRLTPLVDSPVHGPSPLNNQYLYFQPGPLYGVI